MILHSYNLDMGSVAFLLLSCILTLAVSNKVYFVQHKALLLFLDWLLLYVTFIWEPFQLTSKKMQNGNPFNLQAKRCKIRLTVHCFADTVSDFYPNDSHFSVSTWNIGAKASCASFFSSALFILKKMRKKTFRPKKLTYNLETKELDTKISCWLIHGYRYNKELQIQQRVIWWLHEDFV